MRRKTPTTRRIGNSGTSPVDGGRISMGRSPGDSAPTLPDDGLSTGFGSAGTGLPPRQNGP